MSSPRVCVVVVNWNTRDLLRACLESVVRAAETCSLECLVVDNGSVDGSAEMVQSEFPTIRLIRNEHNLGFARANNQAFAEARGDYVLLLNSDSSLYDDALRVAVEYADEHPETGIIGGRQTDPEGRELPSSMRFPRLGGVLLAASGLPIIFPRSALLNWERYGCARWDEPRSVEFVVGSFLLVRRQLLEELGPLDPRFFVYGEEADLCYRVCRGGSLVEQIPELVVRHAVGGSARGPRIAAWVHEAKQRGILLFLHKWEGLLTAWFANLFMLLGLGPRLVLWLPGDLIDRLRGRRPAWGRIAKLRIFRYHVVSLLNPRLLTETIRAPRALDLEAAPRKDPDPKPLTHRGQGAKLR